MKIQYTNTNKSEWLQRRQRNRSNRYISEQKMTRAEERENQNKPYPNEKSAKIGIGTSQGKFISACLNAYIAGETEKFERYSDKTKELVRKMFELSKNGNASAMQEMLNRVEGKVKDEIIIENKIADHIPDQRKKQNILDKYQRKRENTEIEETLQ